MYESELEFLKNAVLSSYDSASIGTFSAKDKGICDVVTTVDTGIEKKLCEAIKESYPDDFVHGEEFSSDSEIKDRTWIIDPIDGTYNFSVGDEYFGVQTAFFDKGEVKISVIYIPYGKKLYWAVKGKGAYLNGKRIFVSERNPDKAIVSFGDFSRKSKANAEFQMKIISKSYGKIGRARMFGASSIDFTKLSEGKIDGTLLMTKNAWDIAPGMLLCTEAGGITFGSDKEPYDFSKKGILAVNKKELMEALLD